MNITEETYNYNENDLISIVEARYIKDYLIKLIFNDGSEKTVDFGNFLNSSHHPQIRKYLKTEKFKEFSIIDGNINWNDYDMIFPLEDLYNGEI